MKLDRAVFKRNVKELKGVKSLFERAVEDIDFDPDVISDKYYSEILEDPRVKELAERGSKEQLAAVIVLLAENL